MVVAFWLTCTVTEDRVSPASCVNVKENKATGALDALTKIGSKTSEVGPVVILTVAWAAGMRAANKTKTTNPERNFVIFSFF